MDVSTRSTKKSPLKKYNKNPAQAAGFFAVVRLAGWLKSRMNGVKSRMNGLRSRMNSEKSRMNSVKSGMNSVKPRMKSVKWHVHNVKAGMNNGMSGQHAARRASKPKTQRKPARRAN